MVRHRNNAELKHYSYFNSSSFNLRGNVQQ